jgi:hypothetical protein
MSVGLLVCLGSDIGAFASEVLNRNDQANDDGEHEDNAVPADVAVDFSGSSCFFHVVSSLRLLFFCSYGGQT